MASATGKKTATASKKGQPKICDTNDQTDNNFLFLGQSPADREQKWLTKINELVKRKKSRNEEDKFSENLGHLYDELLKELCRRCGEPFEAIFSTINGDADSQQSATPRETPLVTQVEKKLSEKESEIFKLEEEKENVTRELENKTDELKKLQIQIGEHQSDHSKEINDLKNKIQCAEKKASEAENKLKFKIDSVKTESSNQEARLEDAIKNYTNLQDEIKKRSKLLEDEREKRQEVEKEKDRLQQHSMSLQKKIVELLEKEKHKLREERKNSMKGSEQRLKELEEENEKLRDRLSHVAGSRLTNNNPAIADLGDPNRPTQLGEKFSELYDNEWTDAMEELGSAGDEKSNISTLRNIVEKAYEFGKARSANYVKELEHALLSISNSIEVSSEISKHIKDHRKNISVLVTDGLFQSFLSAHTEFNTGGEAVKIFMKKTVFICWLMAVQDPPVILTTKLSGTFDTDRFRHYTKSGQIVDFVVWPVVYLHENGPIICKGVAQGK